MNLTINLRDFLAGLAMAGLLACPGDANAEDCPGENRVNFTLSEKAYEYADEMLEARKERSEK